jgi:hypothetical protein
MPHMTEAPTTALIDTQHDLMATPLTTSPSFAQRWRPAALLHGLQTLVASCTRRRPLESRWIRPGLTRQETVTDHLVRQHVHLYIRALLG